MTQLEKVKKIVRILKRKSLGESDTERIYIAYLIIEALDETEKVVVNEPTTRRITVYPNKEE